MARKKYTSYDLARLKNPICGIYRIRCSVTGMVYVGMSVNISLRKRTHFETLRRGNHTCRAMQSEYNKFGASVFTHKILERCEEGLLRSREAYWIDKVKRGGRVKIYNYEPDGESISRYMKARVRKEIKDISYIEWQSQNEQQWQH